MFPGEAKALLIRLIVDQAAREGAPLDPLEQRMLAFSEQTQSPAEVAELNEAFEQDHDDIEYEAKIAALIRRLLARLRSEDNPDLAHWNDAVAALSEEDHYILVLIALANHRFKPAGKGRPPYDALKLLATAAAIVIIMTIVALTIAVFSAR